VPFSKIGPPLPPLRLNALAIKKSASTALVVYVGGRWSVFFWTGPCHVSAELEESSTKPPGKGIVRENAVSPEEYRKKAAQAELALLNSSDSDVRVAYANLADSWRELAHELDMANRAQARTASYRLVCPAV
jgi:hypothetical protein